ncbi:MAG: hypothetical protein EDQ89_01765 [Acidobacteria bacterium]|nr:MAG: hypothetical protein EDQ89_01765 [Acidobacteriota bacterium]MCL4286087.1 acetylxylan esterase [Thermoleophilia bacterium]GIK77346.1 MAG: hypothetical protein BroJett022_10360 [Actinomycetes bacterium]
MIWRTTTGIVIAAALASLLAAPAPAGAAITEVFTGAGSPAGTVESSPVACTVQTGGVADGQRWCTGSPSLVQSFDGTPIDVSVFLPPEPAAGSDGGFPLIGLYHGWSGQKAGSGRARDWLEDGYAVFTMQARGWWASCGTAAARASVPSWGTCANGQIRLMDYRYEIRDAQYLISLLVDEGVADPDRIGQSGGSYGGIASVTLGALNDMSMNLAGQYVPWTSPGGIPLHTAAAAPAQLGSDILYTQLPNGAFLDYAAWSPYFGPGGDARVGVQKYTVMNGFMGSFLDGTNTIGNPSPELLGLASAANASGPYDALKPALEAIVATHGAYNVDRSIEPAPMILSDGLVDDFVPGDESIKLFNKIRTYFPEVPVSMLLGDMGHRRSQDKADAIAALRARQHAWMNHYVRDRRAGAPPPADITVYGFTCPGSAPSGGPYAFGSWDQASPGEIRIRRTDADRTIAATGALNGADFSAPTATGPCTSVDATNNPATANFLTRAATGGGYTLSGSTTLLMRLEVGGQSDQLAARLLDVAPDGTETLVQRGLLRPGVGTPGAVQVLQLHPNWWQVEPGHRLKVELLADDFPYSHLNAATPDAAAQHPIEVRDIEIRIPTLEGPGASGGLVTAPKRQYLPDGYEPASGFGGETTARAPDFDVPTAKVKRIAVAGKRRRGSGRGRARRARVKVRFGGHDRGGSGIARFDCRIDDGRWRRCRSPVRYRGIGRGAHAFRVRATDGDGNVSSPASKRFRVKPEPGAGASRS